MSLRINDLAPDFNVKLLLEILTFMNGLVIVGFYYFRTPKTLPLYVQLN